MRIITIVRLYDRESDAVAAVTELRGAGVPEHDISLVIRGDRVGAAAKGAEIGALVGGLAGLITGLGLVAIPGIGPAIATGWLYATITGAATGAFAGGAIGVLSEAGVSGEEAHEIAEALRRGASLVAARVPETEKGHCEAILDRGAINMRVRVADYRSAGWTAYDPHAAPHTAEQIRR